MLEQCWNRQKVTVCSENGHCEMHDLVEGCYENARPLCLVEAHLKGVNTVAVHILLGTRKKNGIIP